MSSRRAAHPLVLLALAVQVGCDRPAGPAPAPAPSSAEARPEATAPPGLTVRLEPLEPGSPMLLAYHEFGDRLRLPDSRIFEPLRAGAVVLVTPGAVRFDDREVAAIVDGRVAPGDVVEHRITRLSAALAPAPGREAATRVILFVDRRVTTDALLDVMYTFGRAGASQFQLAVHPVEAAEANLVAGLTFSPPTSVPLGFDRQLGLELDPVHLRIGELFPGDEPFTHRPKWSRSVAWPGDPGTAARLAGLVQQIAGAVQGPADAPRPVLTRVLPGVSVAALVAARDLAAGPECDADALGRGDRTRCLFMRWVIASDTAPLAESPAASSGGTTSSLDRDAIRRVARSHIADVRACYEQGLARRPELRGRVEVEFTIGPTGAVLRASGAAGTLDDPAVVECITAAVLRWTFPKSAGETVVRYPFELEPG